MFVEFNSQRIMNYNTSGNWVFFTKEGGLDLFITKVLVRSFRNENSLGRSLWCELISNIVKV